MKRSPALWSNLLSLLAFAAVVAWWYPRLGSPIASHFGPGGVADAWMGKGAFFGVLGAAVLLCGPLIWATTPLLGRVSPRWVNIPNWDHWMAPERREASMAWMGEALGVFGAFTTLFLTGVVHLVAQANQLPEPTLSEGPLWVGLVAYSLGTLMWILWLYRHFGRIEPAR